LIFTSQIEAKFVKNITDPLYKHDRILLKTRT